MKRILLTLLFLTLVLVGCKTVDDKTADESFADNSPEEYHLTGGLGSSYDTSGMPTFDMPPGVYYDPVTVKLSVTNPAYTVRYTTDCSIPTEDSPIYHEPFLFQYRESDAANSEVSVFNIRAAAFDSDGNMIGRTVSASYILPKSKDRFTVRVVSLITEEKNLHGDTGILTQYNSRGREWERPVHFQYYDENGKPVVQQDLGFRVQGAGTRSNAQKSFRLYARKDYTMETGHLLGTLFPGLMSEYTGAQIEEFDTFLLRGGASNFKNTMLTNAIAFDLMEGTAVEGANYIPTACFLNGEYYGLMMLMEDYAPYYFESHHGVDENHVTTINYTVLDTGKVGWEADDCTQEEFDEWAAVRNFLEKADMSDPDNYALACSYIDIENFIQYITYECYLNNWDWPRNNQRLWRYHGIDSATSVSGSAQAGGYDPDAAYGFDGRWRFLCKDMDITHGLEIVAQSNSYYKYSKRDTDFYDCMTKDERGTNRMYAMFTNLFRSRAFCKQYHLYICEFMSTLVNPAQYVDFINESILRVADEMKHHIAQYEYSHSTWDRWLQAMRTFAVERPDYVLEDINAFIKKSNAASYQPRITALTLKSFEHGSFTFNRGTFTDGRTLYAPLNTAIPVTFSPVPGYRLSDIKVEGGSYDSQKGTLTVKTTSCTITITFVPDPGQPLPEAPSPALPVINEIGHSVIEEVNGSDWIELYNPTEREIVLKGWKLQNGVQSSLLPAIVLPAGGFKTLLCSGGTEGGVFLPFTLSEGDEIVLTDAEGNVVEQIALLTKASTTHLGRYPDGGDWVELSRTELTPNAPNIHVDHFEHLHGTTIRNTALIDGILLPTSIFRVDEKTGHLMTTYGELRDFAALHGSKLNTFLKSFSLTDPDAVIDMHKWYEGYKGYIYYIASFNCYLLHY